MEKKPCAELSEVTSWLENDNNLLSGVQVNSKTIKSFTFYQIKKFKCGQDDTKHMGGNNRPTIPQAKQYSCPYCCQ